LFISISFQNNQLRVYYTVNFHTETGWSKRCITLLLHMVCTEYIQKSGYNLNTVLHLFYCGITSN